MENFQKVIASEVNQNFTNGKKLLKFSRNLLMANVLIWH